MNRTYLLCALIGAAIVPLGCGTVRQSTQFAAQMPDEKGPPKSACPEECEKPPEPPKTLFTWAVGKDEGKKDDAPEVDRITTDRPDFTEASNTVGKGRYQLEMGYTYFKDQDGGGVNHLHSYPEILMRIGMFAEWFELRLGQTVYNERDRTVAGVETSRDGFFDFYVGSKIGLTEQKGIWPESAMILAAFVPTGSEEFTAGRVLPTASYLFGWDVTDKLAFGGSTIITKAVQDDGHSFYVFSESLTTGYQWTDRVANYLECFALHPSSATATDAKPQYYFNGGVTYLITPLAQFDVRAGIGLNQAAADFFCGAGLSVKY